MSVCPCLSCLSVLLSVCLCPFVCLVLSFLFCPSCLVCRLCLSIWLVCLSFLSCLSPAPLSVYRSHLLPPSLHSLNQSSTHMPFVQLNLFFWFYTLSVYFFIGALSFFSPSLMRVQTFLCNSVNTFCLRPFVNLSYSVSLPCLTMPARLSHLSHAHT
jgi:hypothetical protein